MGLGSAEIRIVSACRPLRTPRNAVRLEYFTATTTPTPIESDSSLTQRRCHHSATSRRETSHTTMLDIALYVSHDRSHRCPALHLATNNKRGADMKTIHWTSLLSDAKSACISDDYGTGVGYLSVYDSLPWPPDGTKSSARPLIDYSGSLVVCWTSLSSLMS